VANTRAQQAKIAAQRAAAAQAAAAKEAARVASVWAQRERSKPNDPNFDYVWREPTVRNGVVVKKSGWEAVPRGLPPITPSFSQLFPGVPQVAPFTPLEQEAQALAVQNSRNLYPQVQAQLEQLRQFSTEAAQPIIQWADRMMTPEAMAGKPTAQTQQLIDQILGDRSLEDQNAWLQRTYLSPEALEGKPNAQTQSIIDRILANKEGNQLRNFLTSTYMTPEALAGRPGDQAQGIINNLLANTEGNRLNEELYRRFLSDEALDIGQNKIWQDAANAAIQPMQAQFVEEVLPQLRAQGIESGGLGGTRLALAGGLATDKFNQAALNTRANIFADAQRQALANALQGGQLIGQNNEAYAGTQKQIAGLLEQLREAAQNRGLQAGGMVQQGDEAFAARQQALAGLLQQAREAAQQRGVAVSGLVSGNNQFRQGMQGDISRFLQQTSENARNAGLAAANLRSNVLSGVVGGNAELLNSILNIGDRGAGNLANIGMAQRQMNQANIDNVLRRLNEQSALGDQYFNNYLNSILSGNFGSTQTSRGTNPSYPSGGLQGALGGAAAGAGIGTAIFPGIGTAIGALGGGLLGGFG
jgi:hypothetical protein